MIEASPLPSVRRAIASLVTWGLSPLSELIAACIRRVGWTSFAEEAHPPSRLGPLHLGKLPGSTQTSSKMGPKIGETAP